MGEISRLSESGKEHGEAMPMRTVARIIKLPEEGDQIATIVIPSWSSDPFEYPLDFDALTQAGLRVEEGACFFGVINLSANSVEELGLLPSSYEVNGDGFLAPEQERRFEERGL
jgi:hypothetical protein